MTRMLTPAWYDGQSGQSLIEHSYKADSDLSPAGWEYAERLKEFVSERRAKSLEQRGYNPNDRRLVVRATSLFSILVLNSNRFGRRHGAVLITPLGHFSRSHKRRLRLNPPLQASLPQRIEPTSPRNLLPGATSRSLKNPKCRR
jgi:hypothetical protein